MPSPIIENFVQFTHLNELYGYPPSMYVVLMAWVFGLDLESYREVKGRLGANAREASRDSSKTLLSPGASTGCRSGPGMQW